MLDRPLPREWIESKARTADDLYCWCVDNLKEFPPAQGEWIDYVKQRLQTLDRIESVIKEPVTTAELEARELRPLQIIPRKVMNHCHQCGALKEIGSCCDACGFMNSAES